MQLKKHPKFIFNLIKLSAQIIYYKLSKHKIAVIYGASGLGDYLWIRNCMQKLKHSEKFDSYKFFLIGTERWKDFALKIDKENFDIALFQDNPTKIEFFEKLFFNFFKFNVYITLIHSRFLHVKADKIYEDEQFDKPIFYSERNTKFLASILDAPAEISFDLDYKNIRPDKTIDEPYIYLALGGYSVGTMNRSQILSIINTVCLLNPNMKILLAGDRKDKVLLNEVTESFSFKNSSIINGCDVYKPYELPYLIDNSEFVITPNTSVYHMALLLKKKGICLSVEKVAKTTLNIDDKNIKCILTDENDISYIDENLISEEIRKIMSDNVKTL